MKESKHKCKACSFCGVVYTEDKLVELDGKKMCSECGRIIHREDAYYEDGDDEPMCYRCYEDSQEHGYIEDYFYKPKPIFYGKGKRFFGVELEVDNGGEVDNIIKTTKNKQSLVGAN